MESLPIISDDQPRQTPLPESGGEGRGTYSFISLGCPKNLVDSERMLGLLQVEGYDLVADPVGADFAVVNTCGFIESARAESFSAIDEMLALKKQGALRGVIVSGCLAEREKQKLLDDRPEIDQIIGVFGREEVARVADRFIGGLDEQRTVFQPAPVRPLNDRDRFRITPRHFAYLKISEGCDRLCTFCAIPKMRGKHATKPMEEVIAEAEQLAADGVRELNIVAQDTTYYGMDLYGKPRLAELIERLNQVDGIEWIRLLYLYPMYFTDDVIEAIATSEKVVPYLDMPLQHINDKMLKRMQRRVNRASTEELLGKLRERVEGLVMRTTFITGFPGETDKQFEELAEFVEQQRFERLGVFTYSLEPDTPAAKLPEHLPEDLKNARRDKLMEIQQRVAFEWNEQQQGRRLDVLIDSAIEDESSAWIGRTYTDAPDIDGVAFVTGSDLKPGQFVECEIVGYQDYDLIAVADGVPR